jgi:tetratricopeptide (TPR) repeat protein
MKRGIEETAKHTTVTDICIETLVSGHVTSFSDFFNLVHLEKVIKPNATEQLRTFQDLLRESENSKRSGSSKNVYLALTNLANFFVQSQQVGFIFFSLTPKYEMSIKYLERTLEVSKSLSSSISEFDAYMAYGTALNHVNRMYDALNCFENAKLVSQTLDTTERELVASKGVITVRIKIAKNLAKVKKFSDSINHYNCCMEIMQQGNLMLESTEKELLYELHFNLGKCYKYS